METWDAAKFKSQVRLASYRLAQLRERHDQTSNITRQDIATLIAQGDIEGARSKVERLIRDDRLDALVERLMSYCNVLIDGFPELETISFDDESPVMEAVCSFIVAAPLMGDKDVIALGERLQRKFGPEFSRLAAQNCGNHVPSHIMESLSKRPPLSTQIDVYMVSIAKAYQVEWTPPMLPHQKSHALSAILDPSTLSNVVDLEELRQICAQGVPQQPPWLRPRVWKLLLGTLPPQKDSWEVEAHSKRQSYYQLARPLLDSIQNLPPPTTPLTALDASLLQLEKSLSPLPQELDEELECSPLCPLDDIAPEGLKIDAAGVVDERLRVIRNHIAMADDVTFPPQIQISVSSPPESPVGKDAGETTPDPHIPIRRHSTLLLRLAYIHISLHPATPTTYIMSLLIPLYATMIREIEPAELAHVEADCFWLFVELWGEVGELADREGIQEWMVKFGKRLAWADRELWDDLSRKGLDPALPHYSYRWLAPLLTRTLSLQDVLILWDALFTRRSRTRDDNFKLELLIDICASMLIHARALLLRLGQGVPKSSGLWGDVPVSISSSAPIAFEECFIQGMTFLQNYPLETFGGPERIIETALQLDRRRQSLDRQPLNASDFLRKTVLNGFINRQKPTQDPIRGSDAESDGSPSPEWPDSGTEDGDVTETQGQTLLTKIGGTVWRGITNKSAMDVPPSPLPLPSPLQPSSPAIMSDSPSPKIAAANTLGARIGNTIWRGIANRTSMNEPPSPVDSEHSSLHPGSEGITSPSSLRSYTEKLRDSDAAATLAKVSTNWTAKAASLWGRGNPSSTVSSPELPTHKARSSSVTMTGESLSQLLPKRGSLPSQHSMEYMPPPRPNFRESRFITPEERPGLGSSSRGMVGLAPPPDLLAKGKAAFASLAGQSSTPKTGPRPLFLNSASLITPSHSRNPSRSSTPKPAQRDSTSSTSSSTSLLSTRQNMYSDMDLEPKDAGRFIPLRRGAPMRPSHSGATSAQNLGTGDESEPAENSSPLGSLQTERRTSSEGSPKRGWSRVKLPDSPSTLPSSPPPGTPITSIANPSIHVDNSGTVTQESIVPVESSGLVKPPQVEKKVGRKKSSNTVVKPADSLDDDDSIVQGPSHIRRRYGQPGNSRFKSDPDSRRPRPATENKTSTDTLMPENFDAASITPKATDFPAPLSRQSRSRKLSRSPRRRRSDFSAKGSGEEGDDEGYDGFLSAYESEDLGGKAIY